jgi:hypothetical protein
MTGQELLTNETSKEWVNRLKVVIKAINQYQKTKKPKIESKDPYIPDKTVMLSIGQTVRVQLNKPVDTFSNKLHGTFRASDIRWSRKLSKITNIIIDNAEPLMYQVDDKPTSYTFNQLQVVDEKKIKEPEGISTIEGKPTTYIVKAIKGKRKEKGKIQYLVQWKGYPKESDYTYEPKTELIKNPLVKELITEFENKNKN